MKSFRVARTDGQNSECALGSQRGERHRPNLDRILAEKIVALRVANLSASRLTGLQRRSEVLEVGPADIVGPQEPPRPRLQRSSLIEKQHQYRVHGVEILAQGRLDRIDGCRQVVRS